LGGEFSGDFFFELEMPKLMRKKRKPLRSESRIDMEVFDKSNAGRGKHGAKARLL